jgi:Arc/MetJ-type ribon-helix-helix transcriptional regulator
MIRTQIQLTDEQARALRKIAAAEGRSMADVVRDGLSLLLRGRATADREAVKRRSLAALGRFRSGAPDLASEHDRHLGETLSR